MAVDLRKIKKLIELVEESGIAELEVRDGEESIRIARSAAPAPLPAVTAAPAPEPAAVAPAATAPAVAQQQPATASFGVHSPIAGTFYRAAAPDADVFVEVGQAVAAGEVLCIIESMKMMNEIVAEKSGVCTAIAAKNGQPVASGDLLFRFS